MISELTFDEGITNTSSGNVVDKTGVQVALDSSYVIEFSMSPEGNDTVAIYKCSTDGEQIAFDSPTTGHYIVYIDPEETIGKAGKYAYVLTVTKSGEVFMMRRGTIIVRGRSQR